jgi:hypothetical protein
MIPVHDMTTSTGIVDPDSVGSVYYWLSCNYYIGTSTTPYTEALKLITNKFCCLFFSTLFNVL